MQHISARGRRRGTEIFSEQSDDLGRSSGAMYRRAELSGSGARGEVTEGQDCGRFRAQNLRVQFLGFEDCASDGHVGEPARDMQFEPDARELRDGLSRVDERSSESGTIRTAKRD